jgi:hypothetical protein
LKEGIVGLRAAILDSNPAISEHIKWNAPSFTYDGIDRVTFRLQPSNRFQLIFHRGAKVRADTADFVFEDNTRGLNWLAPDRAAVDFPNLESVNARKDEVVALVNRWVLA